MNSRLACSTVVDLLYHLENENDTLPKAIVSFSGATTIQLLLTALGTHNSTVRPATEDMENMENRTWKSSEISPFASNLAIVKYTCSNKDPLVKFFLNQKPLALDWCNEDLCTLANFVEKYRVYKEADCQEYFCPQTSGQSKLIYGGVFVIVIVNLILICLY